MTAATATMCENGSATLKIATVREWYEDLLPGIYAKLGTVTVGEVTVHPHSAQRVLEERNKKNRPLRKYQLNLLTRSFTNHDFDMTGETIIFDWNGNMINGAHRMTTCVRTKIPFTTLIVIGVDPEVFRHMDQHAKRTADQVFKIMGEKFSTTLGGVTHLLERFVMGGQFDNVGDSAPTIDQQLRWLEKYPEIRESVAFSRSVNNCILGSPSVAATLHFLFRKVDELKADEFIGGLLRMQTPDEPKWVTANSLIRRMTLFRQQRARPGNNLIAALTIKAWNHFNAGKGYKAVTMKSGEEFPRIYGWTYGPDGLPIFPE